MLYPDTSLLVSAVASEKSSERSQAWLAQHDETLVISDWTIAEFGSALANKVRFGALSEEKRSAAARWFRNLAEDSATILPVSRASFRRAASLAAMTGAKVRAPDALHLAVAEEAGLTLFTLDRDQAEAGAAAGIRAQLL